jgi:hypothetical protein
MTFISFQQAGYSGRRHTAVTGLHDGTMSLASERDAISNRGIFTIAGYNARRFSRIVQLIGLCLI